MKSGVLGAVVAVAIVVSGCAAAAEAGVTAQGSQQTERSDPDYCSFDYKTLITATEAFWAMNMEFPHSQSELVDAGLMRDVIDDFELTIVGDDYTVVGAARCEGFDTDAFYNERAPVPETTPASEPTPETPSEAAACETDLRTLEVAWEAFNIDYGRPPESESDLVEAGFLRKESSGYDLVGGEFVAVPGVCG